MKKKITTLIILAFSIQAMPSNCIVKMMNTQANGKCVDYNGFTTCIPSSLEMPAKLFSAAQNMTGKQWCAGTGYNPRDPRKQLLWGVCFPQGSPNVVLTVPPACLFPVAATSLMPSMMPTLSPISSPTSSPVIVQATSSPSYSAEYEPTNTPTTIVDIVETNAPVSQAELTRNPTVALTSAPISSKSPTMTFTKAPTVMVTSSPTLMTGPPVSNAPTKSSSATQVVVSWCIGVATSLVGILLM